MKNAAFVHSKKLDESGYPPHCPFNTKRAGKTLELAESMGLMGGSHNSVVEPQPATDEEMLWFHAPDYLQMLKSITSDKFTDETLKFGLGTMDCPLFAHLFDYVSLAAGASVTGARLLLDGAADIAFNPSGGYHHAHAREAAGFCYVNDIVLAAETLVRGGKRVAFVDIDVHHCDGVQEAFYHRSDVLTISLHEGGKTLFPGTGDVLEAGSGEGRGYSVNFPLPVGTYNKAYHKAWYGIVPPLLDAYKPDVIMLELGMDGLSGDPLAHLNLTNTVYIPILQKLLEYNLPLLVTGGGGYDINSTVRGWTLAWSVLTEQYSDEELLGMGGVMMENTDWLAGLRDRSMLADAGQRITIDASIEHTLTQIRETIFPVFGITQT
ncbi:MAG: acetoin utilization protein AcuC [Chitinivibrionales bacterium]|nr:acetoin utilization protein AcuC [Chitinivibrionales bacterium]